MANQTKKQTAKKHNKTNKQATAKKWRNNKQTSYKKHGEPDQKKNCKKIANQTKQKIQNITAN